jgi:hypothetical protein
MPGLPASLKVWQATQPTFFVSASPFLGSADASSVSIEGWAGAAAAACAGGGNGDRRGQRHRVGRQRTQIGDHIRAFLVIADALEGSR